MSAKLQTVHVRVNDAATGKPTPCRVRFTDGAGKYYAPFGRLTEFARGTNVDVGGNLYIGDKQYAYVDGAFEIALPPGTIHYEISKGPEYTPLNETFDLIPGKLALRLTLKRWIDMRAQGWYSGDGRCHFLSPHAALLEGAAEDLWVVNLLIMQTWVDESSDTLAHLEKRDDSRITYRAVPHFDAFSGHKPCLDKDDRMVVVNSFNYHHFLGALALLNCHRVVYPLTFGHVDTENPADSWSLADWCDQCHRKRGLVSWAVDYDREAPEALANTILGRVDAVEFGGDCWEDQLPIWYRLLNCGIRIPLVGASTKSTNFVALGSVRTFCKLNQGEPLSYQNWIEALRQGSSFISSGPLLTFRVNGIEAGHTLHLEIGAPINIVVEAKSLIPFERLELVHNGAVVTEVSTTGVPSTARLEINWTSNKSGWVAARCRGNMRIRGSCLAHTSPVFLSISGESPSVDSRDIEDMLNMLAEGTLWIQREGHFENDRQRERLEAIFASAKQVLLDKLK